MTIPPFPRHFVTVLAFSQSKRQSGSLGNRPPLCRGTRLRRPVVPLPPAPAEPNLAAGPVPGRPAAAGFFPPGSPAALRAPRTQQPRVVAVWIHAGHTHEGLAPGSEPLSPPARDLGARSPGSLPDASGTRRQSSPSSRPTGRASAPTAGATDLSGRCLPGTGAARYSVLQPCPVPVVVPAPRGTSPNTVGGSPWGRSQAAYDPRES